MSSPLKQKGKQEGQKMGDGVVQKLLIWLEGLSKGIISHELEELTLEGLQLLQGQKGFIRCHFVVPSRVSDADGNWHVGAMATMIDVVGAAAIYSVVDHIKASLDFNISFYSTAKIQEEVEIEAKVIGEKGEGKPFTGGGGDQEERKWRANCFG